MMNSIKHTLLVLVFGSVALLLSCSDDDSTDPPAVEAGFSVAIDQETGVATFTNTSENATSYQWNFGDGNSSTDENPTNTYAEDGTYKVVLTASNDAGDQDTAERDVTITLAGDDVAPVITLNEGAEIEIDQGDTFTDPGATAIDDVDGDISQDIEVGGDAVDATKAGTYVITYNVTDASGNEAEEVTRTVRVRYPDGLITNGDFEGAVADPWFVNFGDPAVVPVQKDGTNSFFQVDIETANPAEPFTVNLSQIVDVELNTSYVLSFNASSGGNRSIKAGIGVNGGASGGNFQSVDEVVAITNTETRYELNVNTNGFEDAAIRVLFDLAGETGVVVLDNIALVVDDTQKPTIPVDFESDNLVYSFGDFNGGVVTRIDNPDKSGINTSNKVARMVKGAGETFGGSSMVLEEAIDFSTKKTFKMKVWVPKAAVPVTLKVENSEDGNINFEAVATTSVTSAWEELSFDYSAIDVSKSYDKLVWIFENGTVGDGSANFTYYFDDIVQEGTTTPPSGNFALPEDFEDGATFGGVFEEGDGVTGANITNPDQSGINTSSKVYKFTKAAGAAWYSGMFNVFSADIDASAGEVFKVKMWSPTAGVNVRFQLEKEGNQGPIVTYNVDQTISAAQTWEELTFDFSGSALDLADGYDKIVIYPDYDESNMVPVATEAIYYVDDIIQEEAAGGGTPTSFCDEEIAAFGGDAGSNILLSVFNVDATTMKVRIESADSDPVDALVLPLGDWTPNDAGTSGPSEVSTGIWEQEFFFPGSVPTEVEFYLLWSKVSFGGNWQSSTYTVSFDATCP